MAMTSMKMTSGEAKSYSSPIVSDAPMYPYGLAVSLNHEAVQKLGLDKAMPSVGQKLMLMAHVEVTTVRSDKEYDGDVRMNIELQITDMDVMPLREELDAKALYPNMNGGA